MPKYRDFFKSLTSDLDDPRILSLTWEQRGVLDAALKFQARTSSVPGCFLSPTGFPMTIEQIAAFIHAPAALVASTFEACAATDPPLLVCSKRNGWEKPDWMKRYSFESQLAEIREAWRERKRKQREQERKEKLEQERASKVTPMRRREGEADR